MWGTVFRSEFWNIIDTFIFLLCVPDGVHLERDFQILFPPYRLECENVTVGFRLQSEKWRNLAGIIGFFFNFFLKRESLRLILIGKLHRKIFSFTKVKLISLHISFLRIKIIIKFYVLLLILIIFYFKNTLLAARRQNNSEATLIWIKKSRQKI